MKKLVILIALGSLVLLGGGQAVAELGTVDAVPAATLLLPHFEVDLASNSGIDTLFSVNNASAAPALAHITVWTEFTIPVLDFDVYLTGYDVQTISMRNVLVNGILPQTGPHPDVSNVGSLSTAPNPFGAAFAANCNQGTSPPQPPVYTQPLPDGFIALLQAELSGTDIGGGNCTSAAGDGTLARGYITIDSVTDCSLEFPNSANYFSDGGVGIANNLNVLWGDYFLIDRANAFAQGFTLVHVEADASLNACVVDGNPQTFYCRYTDAAGQPGADNREALGSEFAVRYLAGGDFDGGTNLLSYRDPGDPANAPVACGSAPANMPFTQAGITVFDEQENPLTVVTGGPSGLPPADAETPFPWESNRTVVGTDLTVNANFGWLLLDLDQASGANPAEQNQAYVVAVADALGQFSVGYDAIQLNNLSN